MIQVFCDSCKRPLEVADSMKGQAVACPVCKTVIHVPPDALDSPPIISLTDEIPKAASSRRTKKQQILKECPACKMKIPQKSSVCPYCKKKVSVIGIIEDGGKAVGDFGKNIIGIVLLIVLLLVLFGLIKACE